MRFDRREWVTTQNLAGAAFGLLFLTALYLVTHRSDRHAAVLRADTEPRYVAEGILANAINHLKKSSWQMRYYDLDRSAGTTEGNYGSGEYSLFVSDVTAGATGVTPNLVDVFIRLRFQDTIRNYGARLRYRTPSPLRPTPYRLLRFAEVPGDVTQPAIRTSVAAEFTQDLTTYAEQRAGADVAARLVRIDALSDASPTAAQIVNHLTSTDLAPRIAGERSVVEAIQRAEQAYTNDGRAGLYEDALRNYDVARAATEAQNKPETLEDFKNNAPRVMYGRAVVLMGLAESVANTAADFDDPKQMTARRVLLDEARTLLAGLRKNYPQSALVPYAMIRQAKLALMSRPGAARGDVGRFLKELVAFGGWHLWNEDRPVVGTTAANGIGNMLRTIYGDTVPAVAPDPAPLTCWNVWAVNLFNGEEVAAFPLTCFADQDPDATAATVDLVGTSADGTKVACRVLKRVRPAPAQCVYTMDLDGLNVRDITASAPGDRNQGFQPPWFATWKRDEKLVPAHALAFAATPEADLAGKPLEGLGMGYLRGATRALQATLQAKKAAKPLLDAASALARALEGQAIPVLPPAAAVAPFGVSHQLGGHEQWEALGKEWTRILAPPSWEPAAAQGAIKLFEAVTRGLDGRNAELVQAALAAARLLSMPPLGAPLYPSTPQSSPALEKVSEE